MGASSSRRSLGPTDCLVSYGKLKGTPFWTRGTDSTTPSNPGPVTRCRSWLLPLGTQASSSGCASLTPGGTGLQSPFPASPRKPGAVPLPTAPPGTDTASKVRLGFLRKDPRGSGSHAPLHPPLAPRQAPEPQGLPTKPRKEPRGPQLPAGAPFSSPSAAGLETGSKSHPCAPALPGPCARSSQLDREAHLPRCLLKAQLCLAPVGGLPGTSEATGVGEGWARQDGPCLIERVLLPTRRKGEPPFTLLVPTQVLRSRRHGEPGPFCCLKGPQ